MPDVPDVPDVPDTPVEPDVPVVTDCPDGGVKNSEYTIDNCMNDLLRCVNTGGLARGLAELYDPDLMQDVINGLNVCAVQVDKCVADVRVNCSNVYATGADVWIDFNSRIVQPEYYNFVLRKTGLTPNQAMAACRALDNNAIGENVGKYARWDAITATCMIRVAAYNKNDQITNTWLFGAAGDDSPAEVWRETGDAFKCGKDLFGFSLLNKTNTAAVVAMTGGTVLGTVAGAIGGHGDQKFDCGNKRHREKLNEELSNTDLIKINSFLEGDKKINFPIDEKECEKISDVYENYELYVQDIIKNKFKIEVTGNLTVEDEIAIILDGEKKELNNEEKEKILKCLNMEGDCSTDVFHEFLEAIVGELSICTFGDYLKNANLDGCDGKGENIWAAYSKASELSKIFSKIDILDGEDSNMGKAVGVGAATGAGAGALATAITAFVERNNVSCRVANNVAEVGLSKSYSIPTLREFYKQFDLSVPESVEISTKVSDCQTWIDACATIVDVNQCRDAQIVYSSPSQPGTKVIRSACAVVDGVCVENNPVAKSYGVCN